MGGARHVARARAAQREQGIQGLQGAGPVEVAQGRVACRHRRAVVGKRGRAGRGHGDCVKPGPPLPLVTLR